MVGAQHKEDVIGKDVSEFLHPEHETIIERSKHFLEDRKAIRIVRKKINSI